MESKDSPAVAFVRHLWDHSQEATGHSWTRLNSAMSKAVAIAIEGGLLFELDDIAIMRRDFNGSYWYGEDNGESWYATAIGFSHESACKAIEHYRGRKPFVFDGRRLHVGSNVCWPEKGIDVGTVTSFKDADDAVVVCFYAFDEATGHRSKTPTKRFTLKHADIVEREKVRKSDTSLNNDMARIRDTFTRYANDFVFKTFIVDNALFVRIAELPKSKRTKIRQWCDLWMRDPIPEALAKIVVKR